MTYPFSAPVKLRDLGTEVGQSYWAIRRLVISGVAPVAMFPDGQRILPEWANRYRNRGLTGEELLRYREFMQSQREADPVGGGSSE